MSQFYFHLIECDAVIEDDEGLSYVDEAAAFADAIRQIRRMIAVEIVEIGQVDLGRAIDIIGPGDTVRVAFSDAVFVTSLRRDSADATNVAASVPGADQRL